METDTLRLLLFLVSVVAFPGVLYVLIKSRIPHAGKCILGAALLLASRYLLGAVWIPESLAGIRCKTLLVSVSGCLSWVVLCAVLVRNNVRAWVLFVLILLLPFVVRFALFPSLWGSAMTSVHFHDPFRMIFWIFWVVFSWFETVKKGTGTRVTTFGRTVITLVAIVIVAFLASPGLRSGARSFSGDLAGRIRENVSVNWDAIHARTEKIVAAWDKAAAVDRQIVAPGKVSLGKDDTARDIQFHLKSLRHDLLPVNARSFLAGIDSLDRRIASSRKTLETLRERRQLHPEKAKSLDARIARAEANLAALEAGRAEAIAKARADLKAIGLDLPENSPFLSVDLGDLVDNAIVARNIGLVVENLPALMAAAKANPEAARRYYGSYVVMLDMCASCYRQYLEKGDTGIWRDGIARIADNAESARKAAEAKAAEPGRSDAEREAFLHAAATNDRTRKAANAYLATLRNHEEAVRAKLALAERMHEAALSLRQSATLASALGENIASNTADFNSLLELKLPELAMSGDEALSEDFDAITRELQGE